MVDDLAGSRFLARFPASLVARIAFWVFAGVAAYFLWTEHRAHLSQAFPWILLLLCPLMHLFMHHGHGNHPSSSARDERGGG